MAAAYMQGIINGIAAERDEGNIIIWIIQLVYYERRKGC